MISKVLSIVFFVIFLINFSSAYIHLNIYIDETGNALFLGETNEELALPEGIEISEGIIRGSTQDLTNKIGEIWKFNYFLEGAEIYVILPEGAVIKNLSNGEIGLEKDQLAIYIRENIEVEYAIEEVKEGINYVLILAVVLIIALVVFAIYFFKNNRKGKKQDKIKMIEHVLNEREKLILRKLKETGKIKSSRLRKLCDIPKASFSRHLRELEKKKIVKKSGEGKNKFVEMIG